MAANNLIKACLGASILFAIAHPAAGSVARFVAFEEKVQQADSIILGRCISSRSAWDTTGRWILTYSTFQVEKAFKGAALPEVTVVTPGGQVGSIRQATVGVPEFMAGQQNVVFLKEGSAGPTILYLGQGAYDVARDGRGELHVKPVASNLVLVDQQTGKASGGEPARTLRRFEEEVRVVVDRLARERAQRYAVAPPEQSEESTFSAFGPFVKRYRLLLGFVLLAIGITTYLLIRNR